MNFKITTKVISTKISLENRRVIVKIEWCLKDIFKYQAEEYVDKALGEDATNFLINRYRGVTTGIAVCHENDIFNATKGEKIARAKAESKAYFKASKALIGALKIEAQKFNEFSDALYKFSVKAANNAKHNAAYIKSLTSEQE